MADTSQISPFVFGLAGGLILNKDTFSYQPGECKVLRNFEPDIKGGYKKVLGTALYNSNIVPQVSNSSERVVMSAIFNDVVLAARGGTIYRAAATGSWTSVVTSLGTPTTNYDFRKFNFDGTDKIVIVTGTSQPQIIDSSYSTTAVSGTGTSTSFSTVEIFKNHIFFSGATGATQQISFMGPFETNDFTSGAGGGSAINSGSSGTGYNTSGGNAGSNTGGGGGGAPEGASSTGGNGGSGIVILRYPSARIINVGAGLTATTATVGTDSVTTFTAGTGTITFS